AQGAALEPAASGRRVGTVPDLDVLRLRQHIPVEDRVQTLLALIVEVLQQLEDDPTQRDDRDDVDDSHGAGHRVAQRPHQRQGAEGSEEDESDHAEAEDRHDLLRFGQVLDIGLGQVDIADDRGEGQEEEDERDEVRTPRANRVGERGLGQGHALDVLATVGHGGTQQHHKSGDATDNEGVEIYAEGLDEALLDRVGNGRGRGSVRRGTLACLVGEQAAPHADAEGGTDSRARNLLQPQGVANNQPDHAGYLAEVHEHDDETHDDVGHGHQGHDDLGDAGDAGDTTEDDECGQGGDDDRDDQLEGHGVAVEGPTHRVDDGVRLNRVVDEAVGEGQRDGEDDGERLPSQAAGHVERRATVIMAVGVAGLPQLSQGGFHEGGGATDDGDHPHPEDRARPTDGDRQRHAGDVAGTHTGGGGNREGLERRNA